MSHDSNAQKTKLNPNGYNILYHDDGITKASEGKLVEGRPEGLWKNYFENGILKSEGNRTNQELDGTWKFYTKKGILAEEINYKNNLRNGVTNSYNGEGFLVSSMPFINDIKDGVGFTYYNNGAINTETIFVKGNEQGKAYEFSPTGDIIRIKTYENGILTRNQIVNRKNRDGKREGLWKEFYDDRIVKLEGRYRKGKRTGYWKEYSPKGQLVNTRKYDNGELVNDAKELTNLDIKQEFFPDSDGLVRYRGSYRKGLAEGTHIWYNEDGRIDSSKIFKEGKLIAAGKLDLKGLKQGTWKEFYFPEGELKAQGDYIDGYRSGAWKFYFENGALRQVGSYGPKEALIGQWKWYYENAQLLLNEFYKNGKEDGISTEYNDTGKVITQGEYIDGRKEGEWFLEIGDHLEKGVYEYDLKQGEWKHIYLITGKLSFKGEFFDGIPQGEHVWYYDDGLKSLQGEYISGIKDGQWRRFNKDGTIMISIDYESGNEVKVDGVKLKYKQNSTERDDDT